MTESRRNKYFIFLVSFMPRLHTRIVRLLLAHARHRVLHGIIHATIRRVCPVINRVNIQVMGSLRGSGRCCASYASSIAAVELAYYDGCGKRSWDGRPLARWTVDSDDAITTRASIGNRLAATSSAGAA